MQNNSKLKIFFQNLREKYKKMKENDQTIESASENENLKPFNELLIRPTEFYMEKLPQNQLLK